MKKIDANLHHSVSLRKRYRSTLNLPIIKNLLNFTKKTFKSWINEKIAACKKSAAEKQSRAIARESECAVQLREFNGSVYICLNDIPVIKGEYVCGDIVDAVKGVRKAWIQWKENEVGHGTASD